MPLRFSLALAAVFALAACDATGPDLSTSAPPATADVSVTPPVTEAPDLVSVGNFRAGPPDDAGNPQTVVDFTFDQEAYLNGGNRSSFHLVPLDAGDAVDGRAVPPPTDEEGDRVVSVLYKGALVAADYARGFVDTGIVNSAPRSVSAEDPANVNQSAPISNGGLTENPDLIRAVRDGDQVLFEFDEPLTFDDVVQNTNGLRVFFPLAEQQSVPPSAGAIAVKQQDPRTLRAFYGDDLPSGYTLREAIGAYVRQGTVQAAIGSRGGNDGKNAFDEFAPLQTTGAVVCPAVDLPSTPSTGAGPTEAPDLIDVVNFRRGPFTPQFEPTTCVDFVFDQAAYLNGGNRSSFALVPLSGGDALSGSANVTPESDAPGDLVVTVAFPGDLSPTDFARGFVAAGVVNSDPTNISAAEPANAAQASDIEPGTLTENPDLVRAVVSGNKTVQFVFDEPLTVDDVIQSTSGLQIFFPIATEGAVIPVAGAVKVKRISPTTLEASYRDLPAGFSVEDAVGASVAQGTVQAAIGSRGGNDGTNAFDEVFFVAALDPTDQLTCGGFPVTIQGTGDISGTDGPDVILGSEGKDTIKGGGGDDVICGAGGDDKLVGQDGDDILYGGDGRDNLKGNDGSDILVGDDGNDKMAGGNGDDTLDGGAGDDNANGGAGTDACEAESTKRCEV